MVNHTENQEKEVFFNQGEINALKKAIMYLKFSCEETESLLYAGSPLINSALRKILDIDLLNEHAKEFYSERHLENEAFIRSKIERMEKEIGRSFEEKVKESSFKECIYPFKTE